MPEGVGAGNDIGVRQLAQALTVEGLTQLGDDGRAAPRLARSWTWVPSTVASNPSSA